MLTDSCCFMNLTDQGNLAATNIMNDDNDSSIYWDDNNSSFAQNYSNSSLNSTGTFQSPCPLEGEPETFIEVAITHYVGLIGWPTIFLIGCAGNAISFVVFYKTDINKQVSSIYFRALALVDTFVCCFGMVEWLHFIHGLTLENHSALLCSIQDFIYHWSDHMSGWILSAVAIERVVGVSSPYRYKTIYTKKRAILSLIVLVIVVALLDCDHFFKYDIYPPGICYYRADNPAILHYILNIGPYVNIIRDCILPFTTILICNIIIIYHVQAAYRRRRKMSQ